MPHYNLVIGYEVEERKDLFIVTLVFLLSYGFFSFKLILISNALFLPQIPTCSTMPVDF